MIWPGLSKIAVATFGRIHFHDDLEMDREARLAQQQQQQKNLKQQLQQQLQQQDQRKKERNEDTCQQFIDLDAKIDEAVGRSRNISIQNNNSNVNKNNESKASSSCGTNDDIFVLEEPLVHKELKALKRRKSTSPKSMDSLIRRDLRNCFEF
eukprot:Awhi_evm1s4286